MYITDHNEINHLMCDYCGEMSADNPEFKNNHTIDPYVYLAIGIGDTDVAEVVYHFCSHRHMQLWLATGRYFRDHKLEE